MPQCAHPLGQWIPWIGFWVSSQKHSAVWRNQAECGAYSNSDIQNISRKNGLPAYMCKSQSQHARMGVCPCMNMSKHQAKVPSTVQLTTSSISDHGPEASSWMERQYVILNIPKNGDPSTSRTQSVDEAYLYKMRRSQHEISWPQGGLTTRTVT